MQRKLTVLVLLCAGGIALMGDARASAEFEKKLQKADSIRSSQSTNFSRLLDEMQKESAAATVLQKQRLKYLRAYETAIYRDRVDEAVKMAKALYDETKNIDLKYRAGGLVTNLSAINRDFRSGLRYLNNIQLFKHKVTNKNIRHEVSAAGAILYNQLGQYKLGLKYAEEVLEDVPSPRSECLSRHVKTEAMYELKRLPSTDRSIEKAIKLCVTASEPVFTNFIRATHAKLLAAEGKTDQGITLLEQYLPEVRATGYKRLIAEVNSILSELKYTKGDREAAKQHAEAAVALGDEIKSTAALVSAYRTLYKIAEDRKDPGLALLLYKRYAEADVARLNDIKARELAYEIVRHETEQQTQQIALLERNNQLLRLQQTLERESVQKAWMAMVFLTMLLSVIAYWAYQTQRHQKQLRKLAETDALTGLSNRHHFTKETERVLVECARAGEQAGLLMFDLDHFKAINDTYGHGAGDWVLKEVGRVCKSHCREIDYLGRLGGEEFAIFMRGLDQRAATRLAEDCRAHIAQLDTKGTGFSFVVTASFGVTSSAQSGYDLSRLLSHADLMLYRAKKQGRNQVCSYSAKDNASEHRNPRPVPTLAVIAPRN